METEHAALPRLTGWLVLHSTALPVNIVPCLPPSRLRSETGTCLPPSPPCRDVGAARSRISGLEGELAAGRGSMAELERQLATRLQQVTEQLQQVGTCQQVYGCAADGAAAGAGWMSLRCLGALVSGVGGQRGHSAVGEGR